jgi:hypothetical protein
MPVENMAWHEAWGYGGDTGVSHTVQINFGPTMAVAQVSLSGTNGEGMHRAGITQYRTRATPDEPDQDNDFSWDTSGGFPSVAYDPNMTSVTAQLDLGAEQGLHMTLMVWLWS